MKPRRKLGNMPRMSSMQLVGTLDMDVNKTSLVASYNRRKNRHGRTQRR